MATTVLKNPGRALENTSNNVTAAATKNSEAAVSSPPGLISFYHTGKGLYLGNFI